MLQKSALRYLFSDIISDHKKFRNVNISGALEPWNFMDFPETVGNFIIPTDFHSIFQVGLGRARLKPPGGPLGCLGAIPSERLGAALRGCPERGKRRGEGGRCHGQGGSLNGKTHRKTMEIGCLNRKTIGGNIEL